MLRLKHIILACEHVLVQYLLAEGAIEAIDEVVLVRISKLGVSQRYNRDLGPLLTRFAKEPGTVVRP